MRRPIFKISFSNFDAVLHIVFEIFLKVKTNYMNLNSREIFWLSTKSFLNRCCFCCLNCFLLLGQRSSECTYVSTILFVRMPSLCIDIRLLCTCFSKHFSAVHSVVSVCAGNIPLLLKVYMTIFFLFARSNLPNVLISTAEKFFP